MRVPLFFLVGWLVGWLVGETKGLVLRFWGSNNQKFCSSVFLVLGLGARDAVAAFVEQFGFSHPNGMKLIGGYAKIEQILRSRSRAVLAEFLVVRISTSRITMRAQFHFNSRSILKEFSHKRKGWFGFLPQAIAVIIPSDFRQFESVSFPNGAGVFVIP